MSGVRRFLSRREKSPAAAQHRHHLHNSHHQQPSSNLAPPIQTSRPPDHFHHVFTLRNDSPRKSDKDEERKIKAITERLRHYGIDNISEANIEYALRAQSSQGDPEAAFKMLMVLEDTFEGIVKPYDPSVKLVGAVNREATTCYLDALLFSMFAKLDSFEAMLYENFEDAKRKRLAGLMRLWVNMLRTGRLITIDLTEQIQEALAACGWSEAGCVQQQDPSEAFTFITEQLELPMLTLKMDMYHTGKEDPQDDHKFVNERLLEVALLDEPPEGRDVLTLEDCLEHYFNNRIEVKRHLEMQRRNTLTKTASMSTETPTKSEKEKESGTHVEVLEIPETPLAQSPAVLTPAFETAPFPPAGVEKLRPSMARKRADSIFSQRRVELTGTDPAELKKTLSNTPSVESRTRKLSTRTEVLMPAWQFFKLLPWYTDHMPESDAQVAAHFSKKRPVLGICLKRYSYTLSGEARREGRFVDIPLEIAVPNFVSDDSMEDEGPLVGNFRLMLQSVVCHRGVSVHSGHYICLARGRFGTGLWAPEGRSGSHDSSTTSTDTDVEDDPWMRFDDLARERVTPVDIHEALKKETPYMLFYQVMPIGEDGHSVHELPSYTDATSRSQSDAAPLEKPFLHDPDFAEAKLEKVLSEPTASTTSTAHKDTEVQHFDPPPPLSSHSERQSLELPSRGRGAESPPRRKSITFDTTSTSSTAGSIRTATDTGGALTNSVPSTPADEKAGNGFQFLNVAKSMGSRRGSRNSNSTSAGKGSRPSSRGPAEGGSGSGRFSLDLKKLTSMVSNGSGQGKSEAVPVAVGEDGTLVVRPSEQVAAELAGEKDSTGTGNAEMATGSKESVVVPTEQAQAHVVGRPAGGRGGPGAGGQTQKLSRREKSAAKHARKRDGNDDRECVVM